MESHTSCTVCHEGIEVFAVGCCDHVICYKCSCRMRVLCNQFYCPICRADLPQVYLVNKNLKYTDIPRHGYIPNRKYKIFFQDNKVKGLFDELLENRCRICTNARSEKTFKDLQSHLRKEHTLFYCNLCIDHLKLFPFERKYYNRHDLAVHRRQGDKDDSSYKGHPLCQFCDERYMDNDELFRHLRKDHFFCHFCDPEGSTEFYNDYSSLRDHFRDKHFLCQEGACAGHEVRLTHAFRAKIDLQAHTSAEHANNLTKAQVKQMRTIDIDYQLTPRDRRRDRGVVTGADYDEAGPVHTKVYHNSRGSRGHSGRQRYEESRGFQKGNFSEEDVQRAINASLDVMKEAEKKAESPTEELKEEKIVHDTENFPTLGNVKQDRLRVDSPVDSDHKDSDSEALDFSMAKQIALKNKRSVQYGRLISDEFPTLSGEPKGQTTIDVTISTPIQPSVLNKSDPVSKPVSNFTNVISKGPIKSEDFPGLPTKSTSVNSALGSASWVSKPLPKTNKQPHVQMNTTNNNQTTKPTKGTKKIQKTLQDANEFPSLGGQAAAVDINWLQKSTVDKSKHKPEKKAIDWFDADDNFNFSIENVKKQSDHIDDKKTNNSDTKKKKKKKDKNKTSENGSKNNSKSVESTLDSIASTLLNNKKDTGVKVQKTEKQKNIRKETVECLESLISNAKEETKEVDSPKFLSKEEKMAASALKEIEVDNKFSVLSEEPDLISVIEREPAKVTNKKGTEIKLDDFPALGAANPSKAPPPGFAKPLSPSTAIKTPPGFEDATKRPPPGFSKSTSLQQNGHMTSEEKPCNFTLKNIMPMTMEMSNFQYVPPQDSKSRNQKLIQDIMKCCSTDEDGFSQFKLVSAAFRQGTTDASNYYNQCEKIIGKENFERIFPELLVLLPDIDKQQELLTMYKEMQGKSKNIIRISGKSADAPWKQTANFQSCLSCRQVLLSSDYSDHTAGHSNSSDFPMLAGGGSGPVLRAWVKGQ